MSNLKNKFQNKDEYYMSIALKEAKKAYKNGDTPIGCIIVYNKNEKYDKMTKLMEDLNIKDGEILSKGYNKRNLNKTAIAHAEIMAIDKACKKIKDYRLESTTIYVTLEPCQMCAGAIVQSRIERVVIGTMSPKSGCCSSIINILQNDKFNHKVNIENGILEKECSDLMIKFFKGVRNGNKC